MNNELLQATDICKSYGTDDNRITVLRDVCLAVKKKEMIAIVGASGSGKTTLLHILGTLDVPDSGTLIYGDRDLTAQPEQTLADHRNRHIGFIFQFHHLLPEFTAMENIMMPGLIGGNDQEVLKDKAEKLLAAVNLTDRRHHRPGELSGGEQQRVALARALVMEPTLLLADEPTGNLDSASGRRVFTLLQELSETLDLSIVMVTHNMELASAMDRCLTLADGYLQ